MIIRLFKAMSRFFDDTSSGLPGPPPPPITERMRGAGFVWAMREDGSWTEVCTTCGGNCGQCGTSLGMGNPASIETIVKATGMNSGNHAGLPTAW